MARLNQYAVGSSSGSVRTAVPGRRICEGDREDERRHPVSRPFGIVRKEFGADSQPGSGSEGSALRLQQHRLAHGIDALGEEDGHRPGTSALTDPPPGFTKGPDRRALGSRIPVGARCRIQVNGVSRRRCRRGCLGGHCLNVEQGGNRRHVHSGFEKFSSIHGFSLSGFIRQLNAATHRVSLVTPSSLKRPV